MQSILRLLTGACLYLLFSTGVQAQAVCIGCTDGKAAVAPPATSSGGGGAPKRRAADSLVASLCVTSAPYCLVADSRSNVLSLFQNGTGVAAWDIIMLPPGGVRRGYIDEIILDPSWCPPASVRRKFPNLPSGCLPPGHPQNAMGDVKITMSGDFAGTAIRIHDTRGFGSNWPNEDSAGCVRVLNLKSEVLPRIGFGKKGSVEVVFL